MQKIPVTRDGKRGSEVLIIDSLDVVRIDKIQDRKFIIHTLDEQFYLDLYFDSIEEWLFEDGFRLLDSSNIVNMNHITEYDQKKGIVYLGDARNRKAKTASAASIHKEHIENIIEMLQDSKNRTTKWGYDDKFLEEKAKQYPLQEHEELFLRSYATIRAVNERKKAEEKIKHMAYHDALTNLPNRLLFHERLNELFLDYKINGKSIAVIFVDVDRFKIINDTLGHDSGDDLLKYCAQKLESYVRPGDMVARYGGDEFIIMMTQISHIDEVTSFAKGIPCLFSEPFMCDSQEIYVTASLGISLYPEDGADTNSLIKNAGMAVYRAKEKGGNTYQVYYKEMNNRSIEQLTLEVNLHRALDRKEIVVYYQPILELETGAIFGMESLVRWEHPEMGMIPPSDFIPLAEGTGLIVPIGNWVIKQACLDNKHWQTISKNPLCVSVNISVIQFQQPGLYQFIYDTLQETGLDPSLLCLEITEGVAMKNVSYIVETLNEIKQLGVKISIDDFGTGYSSLSYLKRFRVHTLKIDQSFVNDVTSDEDNAAIVTALIGMSHQLKIKSLAEGVETLEQLEFLKSRGCNQIQGYLFSKPLPAAEFELLIKENRNLYDPG
ncbi:MAG TPA: bifunctional diguanylate cyclase/phosphodiesterase [Bacilli bacterium]